MHSDALGTLLDGLHADELRQVLLRLAAMSGESGRVAAETSVLAQLELCEHRRLRAPTAEHQRSSAVSARAATRCSATARTAAQRKLAGAAA